ncbi:hypothetical protein ACFPRL_25560 [Pseudoclavibacter helvolus]
MKLHGEGPDAWRAPGAERGARASSRVLWRVRGHRGRCPSLESVAPARCASWLRSPYAGARGACGTCRV